MQTGAKVALTGSAIIIAFTSGSVLGADVAGQPKVTHDDTVHILHTIQHVPEPGPTVYKTVFPKDCQSAVDEVRQIMPYLATLTRVDGKHMQNLEQTQLDVIEGAGNPALNKDMEGERRYQAVMDPTVTSIEDLKSELQLFMESCKSQLPDGS